MLALIRAAVLAAMAAVCLSFAIPSDAAAKPFVNKDLAQSAIALEAQIGADAGTPTESVAQLRQDADAAFSRNDFRAGMQLLGEIVAAVPNDATTWLRLARAIMQIRPANDTERAQLLDRASAAAYLAYQRTQSREEEADSLAEVGTILSQRQMWRPALDALRLSLQLREVADVRAEYERLREQHGFRVLNYTIDADTASPRACFQFSERLPPRMDFSPFVVVAGTDKPALTVDDKQICVEGLQHGQSYTITLRPGLPSLVSETLSKPATFTIYVRDRAPSVRFSTTAYVLPRVAQNGIPLISVNTRAIAVSIYRISDRSLIDTVVAARYGEPDFQRGLGSYDIEQLKRSRGVAIWSGELAVTQKGLNVEVTTAFPVNEAIGKLAAGVYVMVAQPQELKGLTNDFGSLATQWFIVSDLGIAAYSGNDGIHVFINSLATAQPKSAIQVRLISRGNEVLATRQTDADGQAHFEAGLAGREGGAAPALVAVTDPKGDYAFLSLVAPPFDLTDRGVGGRPSPHGLDAFVYAERGVYRSGETAHLTALLRDAKGAATPGLPLTFVVNRPDGVEFLRTTLNDQGVGGYSLDLALPASAPTGTWHVQTFTDPKRAQVGETTFLVEDYVPDRIAFDLTSSATAIAQNQPAEIDVAGRFLYGAPASGLRLEGEVTIGTATQRAGFAGYQFGLADEEVEAIQQPLENLPTTDASGNAKIAVSLDRLPSSTRPLQAQIAVRMAEPGGRAVEHTLVLPVKPTGPMIGVKPLFSGRSLADGANADFDVVVAAPDGTAVAQKGLRYQLLRIETRYQFYKRDGQWNYEPVKTTSRVADGTLDTTGATPSRISLPVRFGRYRLEVSTADQSGPVTSVDFDSGWYVAASADTPDMLEVALDKPEYKPGDTMTVAVTARSAGLLTLDVIGDRLLASQSAEIKQGLAQIKMQVGRDWGTGAYIVATLRRPLDAPAQRMPGRAIGVQWFSIDRSAKTLAVDLQAPSLLRPNTTMRIPVKVNGLVAGDQARIVVAAVDVGILNLTNYKAPSPEQYYLGQRALAADIRDLYGQLIDGMQGVRGEIRSGGDMGARIQGSPPSGPPVALYSGLITVGPDGTAEVSFAVPDFEGTLRVMAVAWSKDKIGHATADVTVRDPVVLTATLPRFLLPGDRSTIRLDLDNVEGVAGNYTVAVMSADAVLAGAGARQTIALGAKERSAVAVPITAAAAGTGTIRVDVSGPAGFALQRSYELNVRPPAQILARRTVRSLAAGESLTLSSDMFADLVSGTGSVSISVGPSAALDAAALLAALDRYPYRCSEQITSRALPLLYVSALTGDTSTGANARARDRVQRTIEVLLTRQDSTGSFGLWGVGGGDLWLDSYVTDFLSRARENKFVVPETAFRLALNRLRNAAADLSDPGKNGGADLAYALYVLARNGMAPIGDLRYLADAKLDALKTPIAKAHLAAALALAGDRTRAERVFAAALAALEPQTLSDFTDREDYGSTLRDAAAVLTLAAEGGASQATVQAAVDRVEAARASLRPTSTQEDAWLLLAATALSKNAGKISLDVGGQIIDHPLYRTMSAAELQSPLRVTNKGDQTVSAVVTVAGAPVTPEPGTEQGFKIERLTYTLDGKPVDATRVAQNTQLVVVLKITEAEPQFGRIIVADYLPAGFEIDNPRLVSSGETGKLPWITDAAEPVNVEFRDDRFTAAFDRKSGDANVFTVAYVVRAVAPGRYIRPQASVEDMYRPDRYGRTDSGNVEVTAAK